MFRTIASVLLVAAFIGGVVGRHSHTTASCVQCVFAPGGRRGADHVSISAQELLAVKRADARVAAIRAVSVKTARRTFRAAVSRTVFSDSAGGNRILAPPVSRYLRDIAAGIQGRAPPPANHGTASLAC